MDRLNPWARSTTVSTKYLVVATRRHSEATRLLLHNFVHVLTKVLIGSGCASIDSVESTSTMSIERQSQTCTRISQSK